MGSRGGRSARRSRPNRRPFWEVAGLLGGPVLLWVLRIPLTAGILLATQGIAGRPGTADRPDTRCGGSPDYRPIAQCRGPQIIRLTLTSHADRAIVRISRRAIHVNYPVALS